LVSAFRLAQQRGLLKIEQMAVVNLDVHYAQYAHARIASLRHVAATRGIDCPFPSQAALDLLQNPDELALIRKLSAFPVVVQSSAMELEPHRIPSPAPYGEAGDSSLTTGRQQEVLPPELPDARLALLWSVQ
jgi:arginyl-tRNA synthetase